MDRRFFLKGAALLGCSVAAHPLTTTLTLAEAPGEARLVVIILRGAMDGLDVVRPLGDPAYAALRPTLAGAGALPLDGFFALHPALAPLMPLWAAGELGFAHAVSTPYRDKRSHFDGQDVLEAGTGLDVPVPDVRDGWLNRMLVALPWLRAETAYAVGAEALPVLDGAAPVRNWEPELSLDLSAQNRLLLEHVYHDDPLFHASGSEAIELAAGGVAGGGDVSPLVAFTAERLRGESRIAAFSQTGWDTHRAQGRTLVRPLTQLAATITRAEGAAWAGLGPDDGAGDDRVRADRARERIGRDRSRHGRGDADGGRGDPGRAGVRPMAGAGRERALRRARPDAHGGCACLCRLGDAGALRSGPGFS